MTRYNAWGLMGDANRPPPVVVTREPSEDDALGLLSEARVKLSAPAAIRAHPQFAANLLPRIDAYLDWLRRQRRT